MKQIAKTFWRSAQSMLAEDGMMVAGFMSFSALLAIFPFLLCIAAVVSFMGTEAHIEAALEFLFENVPGKVAEGLEPVVREVLGGRKAGFLTFGVLVALWAASNGVEALRQGLNKAYGISKMRPFWLRRLQNLAVVLLGTSILITVGILLVLGPLIMTGVSQFVDVGLSLKIVWVIARYTLSVMLMILMLTGLHLWLPNRRQSFRLIFPGVLVTVLLFVIAATGFSQYLSHFANYSVTYGSIAGVVVAMLFFYITSIIFIFGGYFNRHLLLADNNA